ncbi:MAG: ATP-binding protein [Myxococcota bacterium]
MDAEQPLGVVLGSHDATPLDLWIGVAPGRVVQVDDWVEVRAVLADGRAVSYFGQVDQVRKRFEGSTYDSDAFRVAAGTLPVDTSYAAHVAVTRIEPELYAPPQPGDPAWPVRGDTYDRALGFDQMVKKLPAGLTRADERPVYLDLEFLDGTRGAHASISGVSGVATKTSYATFLLYALFHSDVLGADATNTKAVVFNVKGEDLLWLDHPNRALPERDRARYDKLGLPVGPFRSVGLFAPPRKHSDTLVPDTGGRHHGVAPYVWTVRRLALDGLLRFAFADAEDARAQLSFVISRVERELLSCARTGDPADPGIDLRGHRVTSFQQLVDALDLELDAMCPAVAPGTRDAFRRRLQYAAQHLGHLVRGDADAVGKEPGWRGAQVTVVDLHTLHSTAQMFVVGVLLKKLLEEKERAGTSKPLVLIVLDELNKYAPRTGWSPIQDVLLDVAERGRSLGVVLVGAQQTASEVERRVVANAAVRVVGRLDAAEAGRAEYGWLGGPARDRAAILRPGTMILSQPEWPSPVLVTFPFPAWATRRSEAEVAPVQPALFDRLEVD